MKPPNPQARKDVDVARYLEESARVKSRARYGWLGLIFCLVAWGACYMEFLSGWQQLMLMLAGAAGVAGFLLFVCIAAPEKSGE